MSAYLVLLTPMIDQECLLAALIDLGFDRTKVEVHASPVQLLGYNGYPRAQTANIIIRKQHVGVASNDVGFLATATGYRAIVSNYDHPRFGREWIAQLSQRYQVHEGAKQERLAAEERRRLEEKRQKLVEAQRQAVHARAKTMGYRVEEKREGDQLRLVLVKRVY